MGLKSVIRKPDGQIEISFNYEKDIVRRIKSISVVGGYLKEKYGAFLVIKILWN